MNIHRTVIAAAAAIGIVSCDKPQDKPSNGAPDTKQAFEAKPFRGEVYRAADDSKTLTLISPDECEVKQGGKILLCKYTKQDDALRVVMSVTGTNQVVYYKLLPDGLKEENGAVLLTDALYKAERKRQEEAARARTEKIAALVEESRQQTEAIFKFGQHDDYWVDDKGEIEVKKCYVEISMVRKGKKLHDTVWYGDITRPPDGSNSFIFFSMRSNEGERHFKICCDNGSEAVAYAKRFNSILEDWRNRYGAAVAEYETAARQLGR